MSKDRNYRKIISSARWQHLSKRMKLMSNYECQVCHKVTTRLAVHHLRPIETGRSLAEMEALAFDERNLLVCCFECHKNLHQGEHGNGKEGHLKAEQQRVERFMNTDINEDMLITLE